MDELISQSINQSINKLETHMYSLEDNASLAQCFFTVKSRRRSRLPYFGCFSRYCWVVYPQIL